VADFNTVVDKTAHGGEFGVFDLGHELGEVGVGRSEVFDDDSVIGRLGDEGEFGLLEWWRNVVLGVVPPECLTGEPPIALGDLGTINTLEITEKSGNKPDKSWSARLALGVRWGRRWVKGHPTVG